MSEKKILITAPSLDTKKNVSGISSVTKFIISNNTTHSYKNFELGRKDNEKRNLLWVFRIIKTTFRWMFVVSSSKINLVHFNFALCKASIIRDAPLVLFTRLINKKIIIHLHGGEYLIEQKPPGWMNFFLKQVFAGNIPVLVLSPIEQQAAMQNYKVKNVEALPNCVDLKEAKMLKRSYSSKAALNLLFMGRIIISKGIEHIYQALIILKNKQVPFKFYLAGAGPDEKEYTEKFSALLGNNFEFKGVVSGQVKDDLLKTSDIFLLPSFFPEGLPMALLESMSFGLVPVVTDIGSIKYVVKNEENGIMLGANPAAETAAAIERLVTNREVLETLSVNASNYIFNNYNPDIYINRLNKIYDTA
jgi:glycosyltransferase involved in cell wall biosynthesis